MVLTWALLVAFGACPDGPDSTAVLRRADALRGPGRPVVPWKFSFASSGDEVTLTAAAEGETFQRALPADADCPALTEATAVVLLMLESDLAEAVQARGRTVRTSKAPAPPVPEPPGSSFDLGLGQGVTLAWPAMPWALVARGVWRPPAANLGIGGHLRYHAPRTQLSAPLEVTWSRLELRLGPDLRLHAGVVELAFAAEAITGVLWLRGVTSLGSASFTTWDLGGAGSVRASPARWVGVKPWVELSLFGWARQHRVVIEGTGYATALPVIEADLVVGVSWGR